MRTLPTSGWPGNDRIVAVGRRSWNVIKTTWHLGFTAFGGPPVHFKIEDRRCLFNSRYVGEIERFGLQEFSADHATFRFLVGAKMCLYRQFHDKFVDRLGWIDEQIYQELFAVSQALAGPASTKMLYCINLIHEGFLPAMLGFFMWSLPGAVGMFGLCIGVSNIDETLPRAVYALLSGLNASVVGVIALAATQLSQKAITDKLTRILVFLGGAAGILYNALWYFPIIIVVAGVVTVVHDYRWLHSPVKRLIEIFTFRISRRRQWQEEQGHRDDRLGLDNQRSGGGTQYGDASSRSRVDDDHSVARSQSGSPRHPHQQQDSIQMPTLVGSFIQSRISLPTTPGQPSPSPVLPSERASPRVVPPERRLTMSWKTGLATITFFAASFIVIIALRASLPQKPPLYSLFSNLYLAGTIIFGGGPVVIPLLREYIVAEGWVSPRDFLIGLAVIQAFPGPNFNFAVYLGGLTATKFGYTPLVGAVLGFVGIFAPGLILCHGTMGIWGVVRGWRVVRSALRGFNAAAVGLIFTAVYRLWQIGYIDVDFINGTSLANEPFWVVVTATSYVGGAWLGLNAPASIVLGAVLGLLRYAVVSS